MGGCYNGDMRRAFSLIEILVVIVILSIFAALLFPVFARAKENTQQANCQVHLRQDSIAMQLYRVDHDDKGYRHLTSDVNRYPWNWFDGMAPYINDGRLVWCPELGNWDASMIDHQLYKWQNYADPPEHPLGTSITMVSWDPAPGRVVFYCTNHNRGDQLDLAWYRRGPATFAREDGSAGKVDASRIEHWEYSDSLKEWKKAPFPDMWPASQNYARFPGETWPPIPEK
jgi:prepilin-type N-terminal cleavage/methylation domain-containing protein